MEDFNLNPTQDLERVKQAIQNNAQYANQLSQFQTTTGPSITPIIPSSNLPVSSSKKRFNPRTISLNEKYKRLNNGNYVKRYKSFIQGTDNEDRLARDQSRTEKWINGLTKLGAKTAINVLDGTAGTVYGLVNGLAEGNMSMIYNNDFSKTMDDWNTVLDTNLPNYYNSAEREKGFLKSMGTANFWANDVTQGLSFMLGTIGSEAIWALGTGGASFTTTAARVGLKASARGIGWAAGKQTGKNFYKSNIKLLNAYQRTIPKSKLAAGLNNARFIYTSAGYESGVESRHALNESIESYLESYKSTYGKSPSPQEIQAFYKEAIPSANRVFGANLALVGSSNVVMFGSHFKIAKNFSKGMANASGKVFGVGTKLENGAIKSLQQSGKQKALGNIYSFAKVPLYEGFVEEGGQGVASRTHTNWLASQFNPDALNTNYTSIQAMNDAFSDAYGTKEGFKEVGLGMIIGLFGSARSKGADGSFTPFNIGQYSAQQKVNDKLAEQHKLESLKLNEAQKNLITRLGKHNQLTSSLQNALDNTDAGNHFQASKDWETAMFTKMQIEQQAGLLDESIKNFEHVTENTPLDGLAKELGVTEAQAEKFRTAMVVNYKNQAKLFETATNVAEALSPKTTKGESLKEQLAFNIYMGANSAKSAEKIAEQIQEMLGVGGVADAMEIYSRLDDSLKETLRNYNNAKKRQTRAAQRLVELRASFAQQGVSEKTKTQRTENNKKTVDKISKKQTSLETVEAEVQQLALEVEGLRGQLEGRITQRDYSAILEKLNPFSSPTSVDESTEAYDDYWQQPLRGASSADTGFISVEELDAAYESMESLQKVGDLIDSNSPQVSEQLGLLTQEYARQKRAFIDFNIVFEQLVDSRFDDSAFKSTRKMLKGVLSSEFNDENIYKGMSEQAVEETKQILESNPDLTDNQKFTIQVTQRLLDLGRINKTVTEENTVSEPITGAEYKDFKEGKVSDRIKQEISQKKRDKQTMSPRQEEIYEANKDEIDALEKEEKKEVGDSLEGETTKTEVTPVAKPPLERLKELVQTIKQKNKHLSKFLPEDYDSSQIPTDEDYARFDELTGREIKGTITPRLKAENARLRKKINEWGLVEGTAEGTTMLGDILEQIAVIEAQENVRPDVQDRMLQLADYYDIPDFVESNRNANYDYAQTYDKAIISMKNGNIRIANISLKGFLELIDNAVVTQSKGKAIIEIAGTKIKVVVGTGGNLVMTEKDALFLHNNTDLWIKPSNSIPSGYQPLLRKTGDTLQPVATDFTFGDSFEMDNEAAKSVKIGDELFMVVSMENSYNAKLLKAYQRTKGTQGEQKALQELKDGLVIYLEAKGKKIVGVAKATSEQPTDTSATSFAALQQLRQSVMDLVMELENDTTATGQEIQVPTKLKVAFSYIGHPNLNLVERDGKLLVNELDFTDRALENVTDVGVLLDGKLTLKEDTKDIDKDSFLGKAMKAEKYEGKSVPVVVVSMYGKKIAYPLSLKQTTQSISQGFMDIVENSEFTDMEKIRKVNDYLASHGIDLRKNAITIDTYGTEVMDNLVSELDTHVMFPDISNWKTDTRGVKEIAQQDTRINIDLERTPFHSPKIKTNISGVKLQESLSENFTEISLSDDLINKTTDETNEDC